MIPRIGNVYELILFQNELSHVNADGGLTSILTKSLVYRFGTVLYV